MPSKINLPPGCRSLQMEDGTRYAAPRTGGSVTVSDAHAAAIDRIPGNGTAGLVTGQPGVFVSSGRRNGRWCKACRPARLWQSWTKVCPKCDVLTEPEQQAQASG